LPIALLLFRINKYHFTQDCGTTLSVLREQFVSIKNKVNLFFTGITLT